MHTGDDWEGRKTGKTLVSKCHDAESWSACTLPMHSLRDCLERTPRQSLGKHIFADLSERMHCSTLSAAVKYLHVITEQYYVITCIGRSKRECSKYAPVCADSTGLRNARRLSIEHMDRHNTRWEGGWRLGTCSGGVYGGTR